MKPRQDKIKMLNDIKAGRKTIGDLLPPIFRVWVQDVSDLDLFHYEDEDEKLICRIGETPPSEKKGQKIFNVWEYSANCPPIAENETEFFE